MSYNGVREHNKRNKSKYDTPNYASKRQLKSKKITPDDVKRFVESDNESNMIKCMTCGKLMRNPFGSNVTGTINMNCTHCAHVVKKQKEWDDDGTTVMEKS